MNPMTNTKNIKKLSEQELKTNFKSSWHDQYKDSAWIFVGGLPYDLTEGDIICVFSQYGEVVNINLIRDKVTGKQKGFCFLCYEDQRSTVLAVDNFNGIKILGRTIRVDHVADYKVPKDHKNTDEQTKKVHDEGCAPSVQGHDKKAQLPEKKECEPPPDAFKLPERLPIGSIKAEQLSPDVKVKKEKDKKHKRKRKSKKKHRRRSSGSSSSSSSDTEDSSESSDNEPDMKAKDKSRDEVETGKKLDGYSNRIDSVSRAKSQHQRSKDVSVNRASVSYTKKTYVEPEKKKKKIKIFRT